MNEIILARTELINELTDLINGEYADVETTGGETYYDSLYNDTLDICMAMENEANIVRPIVKRFTDGMEAHRWNTFSQVWEYLKSYLVKE